MRETLEEVEAREGGWFEVTKAETYTGVGDVIFTLIVNSRTSGSAPTDPNLIR